MLKLEKYLIEIVTLIFVFVNLGFVSGTIIWGEDSQKDFIVAGQGFSCRYGGVGWDDCTALGCNFIPNDDYDTELGCREEIGGVQITCCPSDLICDTETGRCEPDIPNPFPCQTLSEDDCNDHEQKAAEEWENINGTEDFCYIQENNMCKDCFCVWDGENCVADFGVHLCNEPDTDVLAHCQASGTAGECNQLGTQRISWTAYYFDESHAAIACNDNQDCLDYILIDNEDVTCDVASGKCISGSCHSGYRDVPCLSGALLGFTGLTGLVIAIILLIIFYLIVIRKKKKTSIVKTETYYHKKIVKRK